jgi:hypothetical protein
MMLCEQGNCTQCLAQTHHWTESIQALAYEELLVVSLSLPSSHVVDDHRAPNMIPCFVLLDTDAALADDYTEFALIVQATCN